MSYEEMRRAMEREISEETPELLDAKQEYPLESWVYLTEAHQYGVVDEVKNSADGILIKVRNTGSVPIKEIRKPTTEELEEYLNRK